MEKKNKVCTIITDSGEVIGKYQSKDFDFQRNGEGNKQMRAEAEAVFKDITSFPKRDRDGKPRPLNREEDLLLGKKLFLKCGGKIIDIYTPPRQHCVHGYKTREVIEQHLVRASDPKSAERKAKAGKGRLLKIFKSEPGVGETESIEFQRKRC